MEASQIPAYKFPDIWADDAAPGNVIYPIPDTTAVPGQASLQIGFPPANFTPTGAGGIPPFGQAANGIFKMITSWEQWAQAGGILLPYDSTFSSAIGGYPAGAIIASASLGSAWLCIADNNTSDPDTGGSGWIGIILPNLYAADTGTADALFVTLPATGPLVGGFTGIPIKIKKGSSANIGGCTLTVNLTSGNATAAILHPDGTALIANELPSGGMLTVVFDGSFFQLQSLGTTPAQPATYAQMEAASSNSVFATPNNLQASPFSVKAFCVWTPLAGGSFVNGITYNVDSVTINGTGNYTFVLSSNLTGISGVGIATAYGNPGPGLTPMLCSVEGPIYNSLDVLVVTATAVNTFAEPTEIQFMVVGLL